MPQWLLASLPTLGAVLAAGVAAWAAMRQSKPSEQQTINQGFADLVKELRAQVADAKATADEANEKAKRAEASSRRAEVRGEQQDEKIGNLEAYERRTSRWHNRHLPFDQGAKEILEKIAPDELGLLPPLEPFPKWEG